MNQLIIRRLLATSLLNQAKLQGRLKWYNTTKFMGFVEQDGDGADLVVFSQSFADKESPRRRLDQQQPVEFNIKERAGKPSNMAIDLSGPNGMPLKADPNWLLYTKFTRPDMKGEHQPKGEQCLRYGTVDGDNILYNNTNDKFVTVENAKIPFQIGMKNKLVHGERVSFVLVASDDDDTRGNLLATRVYQIAEEGEKKEI